MKVKLSPEISSPFLTALATPWIIWYFPSSTKRKVPVLFVIMLLLSLAMPNLRPPTARVRMSEASLEVTHLPPRVLTVRYASLCSFSYSSISIFSTFMWWRLNRYRTLSS